jgi:hypothetical protein
MREDGWQWRGSAAGAAIMALRRACSVSKDDLLKRIAGSFLVPALRVPAGG